MKPQQVSNTLLGFAKLGHHVSIELQRALLVATHRCAVCQDGMNAQGVANTLLALATLQWQVAMQVRVALLCAAGAQAPKMTSQNVANTLLALATLQWPVEAPARRALSHAAGKSIPELTAQGVANTLWAQAWFTVADSKQLQIDSAALFERAAGQVTLEQEALTQVCPDEREEERVSHVDSRWSGVSALCMPALGCNELKLVADPVAEVTTSIVASRMYLTRNQRVLPTCVQVHQARLILQPGAAPSTTLEQLFDSCHRAECERLAAEHAQARKSAKEMVVVTTIEKCVRNSGSAVKVRNATPAGLAHILPRSYGCHAQLSAGYVPFELASVLADRLTLFARAYCVCQDCINIASACPTHSAGVNSGGRWFAFRGRAGDVAGRPAGGRSGRAHPLHPRPRRRQWHRQEHRHAPARPPARGVGRARAVRGGHGRACAAHHLGRLPCGAHSAAARRGRAA